MTEAPDTPAPPERAASAHFAAALAYFRADYVEARAQLEAAYRDYRESGRAADAAHMAMELAEMHHSVFGNTSASNGWLARAERELEPLGDCVGRGYLELALMACDRPDVADLAASAERALAIARRFGDVDLEVRALADGGLALVCQGRLREGFAQLDEALVAISAGDCRRLETAAKSMCSLLTSCDRAGDVRRADEWSRLVQATVLEAGGPTVLAEHCRIVQSGLMAAAGRWDEAEASLTALSATMTATSPHRLEMSARLAGLLLDRGLLEEAEALIAPHSESVLMRAPLARLHLLRGEPHDAVAVAELGLAQLVADRLRGAPLLGLVVQAELARADVPAAQRAAVQLAELVGDAESAGLRADVAVARGRVAAAEGDAGEAVRQLSAAVDGFSDSSRPLHAGVARLELASVLAELGEQAKATAEARSALAVFERLGAPMMIDRAMQVLRPLGARVRPRSDARAVVDGLTPREAEVLDLIREGRTNAEIGARLFISTKTAEHHVGRVLAKLGVRTRTEAAALAAAAKASSAPEP